MSKHPFLSPEWMDEVRNIRDEYRDKVPRLAHVVRMNQVITDVPFGDGSVETYLDTTAGELELELGKLDDPDLTVTLDYETARAIFVDGSPQAAMQAFMAGKIRVDGDMSKLMVMQGTPPDENAQQIARRIKDVTLE